VAVNFPREKIVLFFASQLGENEEQKVELRLKKLDAMFSFNME